MKERNIYRLSCAENLRTICFDGSGIYAGKLQQYLEYPEFYACGKQDICITKTFRHYLRRFIRTFHPEKLLPNKNLWLQMEKCGRFSVRLGRDGEEISDLSETDNYIFQYLCFLHLRRFWDGIWKCCRFPALALPVIIRDFSNRLDESVDYEALLERAAEIFGQVIVLP